MRILYVATDQIVPSPTGGATHVRAVAEGLAGLGHVVHVVATRGAGSLPTDVSWSDVGLPLQRRQLRLTRIRRVMAIARGFEPDVVIERYYNFGGEGIIAARQVGARSVLEVNSPVIDYRGSRKRLLDRALLVEPMRRWREWQLQHADLIVTPSLAIVPANVPAAKIQQLEWGADTARFTPHAFQRGADQTSGRRGLVAVFVGAFHPWHGAIHLVRAVKLLWDRGRTDIRAVLIGTGPQLEPTKREVDNLGNGVTFTGPLPHERVPEHLAAADVGVAPFDPAAHAALQLDFYWSPLKVFEYMASGLPVVTPALERLQQIVRHRQEGLLYSAGRINELADCLTELADDAGLRQALGRAGRARVVERFSWDVHCRRLDELLRELA